MNNFHRFFIKAGIFLSVLLFVWGCNSTEAGNSATTTNNPNITVIAQDGFNIEINKDKNNEITVVHTSDNDVRLILKKESNVYEFTTIEGTSILTVNLNSGQDLNLNYRANSVSFNKNNDDTITIITLSSQE
ncbi:MAG: hypothetical protein LBL65_01105 [Campylobacteraceae bacterium]|jgi:hypothetical protein|nr:hypothetical protein [Campylobacteraceae bacterium]